MFGSFLNKNILKTLCLSGKNKFLYKNLLGIHMNNKEIKKINKYLKINTSLTELNLTSKIIILIKSL
jgi:hypothetical protein